MDNIRFGSFVAQLRKERGLTQKELAQRLHVTDKAVSKWETGRGFPDLKLLEPLAQTLEVSLVELLQGERTSSPTLSVEEAGQVAARAMDQYQQTTVLRYLRLFQFFQKWNDCFFLIVCRNNDQDFFFCFFSNVFSVLHRYYSLSSYAISNSFRISPCSSDIRTVAFFPYSLHFSSFPSSSAIFLLISSGES